MVVRSISVGPGSVSLETMERDVFDPQEMKLSRKPIGPQMDITNSKLQVVLRKISGYIKLGQIHVFRNHGHQLGHWSLSMFRPRDKDWNVIWWLWPIGHSLFRALKCRTWMSSWLAVNPNKKNVHGLVVAQLTNKNRITNMEKFIYEPSTKFFNICNGIAFKQPFRNNFLNGSWWYFPCTETSSTKQLIN